MSFEIVHVMYYSLPLSLFQLFFYNQSPSPYFFEEVFFLIFHFLQGVRNPPPSLNINTLFTIMLTTHDMLSNWLTTLSLVASMPNTFGINSWLTRASILTFPLPNVMLEINVPFLRVIYAAIAVGCVGSLSLLSGLGPAPRVQHVTLRCQRLRTSGQCADLHTEIC